MHMRSRLVLWTMALVLVAPAIPAGGGHRNNDTWRLMPIGHAREPGSFSAGNAHTDLAFWGDLVFQGSYDGFRVVDISDPMAPRVMADVNCQGGQGDVAVWEGLLFRAVDRPQTGRGCDSVDTPGSMPGFEGIQIFDISDPAAPRRIRSVPVDCGAHTITLVPKPGLDRVLLYVSSSFPGFFGRSPFGNECSADHGRIPIVSVPLAAPATADVLRSFPIPGHHCHDIAVHLGVDRAAGACRPRVIVWDISKARQPRRLFSVRRPNVPGWHSASFTWDGRVILMGWEPGGGSEPECETDDPVGERSIFFLRATDGRRLGRWVLPRTQSARENCSIHNYNVMSVAGRYIGVAGNFQAGTSVFRFTDTRAARELAYSDPPPLVPVRTGGAWSSYWYNGYVYESDITEGLNIYEFARAPADVVVLEHLNPQTQERSL